jgi:general secretion pathway protein G
MNTQPRRNRNRGFTLIELLVVLAIIATLLTVAVPSYFASMDNAKETALRKNLSVMRTAIDQYNGDKGKYPDSLQDLVTARYLRALPVDPISGASDQWVAETSTTGSTGTDTSQVGVRDVHSGTPGNAKDGSAYATW